MSKLKTIQLQTLVSDIQATKEIEKKPSEFKDDQHVHDASGEISEHKGTVEPTANDKPNESMCLALKHKSWKDSATLPKGWKFLKTKFQIFFYTENGILIKSCEEALKH